ncbi:MAG TPA: PKD domain-containing protein, partial [Flavitalea sp.]|nr:PKD domain-containing protein [Flavitalea sp.]
MIVRACVILLLLTSSKLFGQAPVADFIISDSAGCAPLVVSFKSTSTGNPTFWNWDFGNGQLSTLENPVTTYSAPGKYTVQLVVRNADGTNGITKTDIITVYASPLASFSADRRNSCLPGSIQFTDLSTDPGGTITNWEWNFGDTTTSTVQNPLHTYNNVGFYGVSLKVTSSNG